MAVRPCAAIHKKYYTALYLRAPSTVLQKLTMYQSATVNSSANTAMQLKCIVVVLLIYSPAPAPAKEASSMTRYHTGGL